MYARKASFSFADGVYAEENEGFGGEQFNSSPDMRALTNNNIDINFLLGLASNSELSSGSSSSESQSQASREASPSDWPLNVPDPADAAALWKWNSEALMNGSIDPSSLMMTASSHLLSSEYPYDPSVDPIFPLNEPMQPIRTKIVPEAVDILYNDPYISNQLPQSPPLQSLVPSQPLHHTSTPMTAEDIGRRAIQAAGIERAMPIEHAYTQPHQAHLQVGAHYQGNNSPTISNAASTSFSHSPVPTAVDVSSPSSNAQLFQKTQRPKTSHTTIERRYRTNLNARIVALRHSVPALRILEADKFPEDKIDARGYVDGVKAARKASKGSILGKAAEYIGYLSLSLGPCHINV
jgi:hypothetical protein